MPGSNGFACPNFSSLFRTAAPADPAVLDVAHAIYAGGRAGGDRGIKAVAHVINNRMSHPSFPDKPQAVVSAGSDQFTRSTRSSSSSLSLQSTEDRQLFEQARRMAQQLVHPPRKLSSVDPTNGAIYYDERAPERIHSKIRPLGSATTSAVVDAPRGPQLSIPPQPILPDAVVAEESMAASINADFGRGASSSPPPRIPATNQRPLSFLRDRRIGGGPDPRHRQVLGESPVQRPPASTPGSGGSRPGSTYQPPARPPVGPSMTVAHSSPASSGSGMWSAPPTPPSPPVPGRAAPTSPSWGAQPSASSSSSALSVAPGSRLRASAPGPRGPEDIPRATARGGLQPPRPLAGVQLGPRDAEGYHDVILSCGLLQDEVIDLMHRDLSPEDFEMLAKLDERLQPRNIAAKNSVDRLPRVPVKDCGCTECAVCLNKLEPAGTAVQLPCRHSFHHECISKWLTQCKNKCPLCSAPIGQSSTTTSC